jgi:hypothetical protein
MTLCDILSEGTQGHWPTSIGNKVGEWT